MKTAIVGIVLSFAGVLAQAQSRVADNIYNQPIGITTNGVVTRFSGIFSPNRNYREFNGVLQPVCIYFATNRAPVVKRTLNLRSQEILKAVAKNGDSFASVAATSRELDKMRFVTLDGASVAEWLHIAVFPNKATVLGDEAGDVTQLQAVLNKWGSPTEKEKWDGPLAAQVGLCATVYWWDGVGIAAGSDNTITHVLTREQEPAVESKR